MTMNVICDNCKAERTMALKYVPSSMSADLAEMVTGVRPHQWRGEAECPCGYDFMILISGTCTKRTVEEGNQ